MRYFNLLFVFVFFISLPGLLAQCPSGQHHIRLEVDPDQYWDEVSWNIASPDGNAVYAAGDCPADAFHTFDYCVPANTCMFFNMFDTYGDGMAPNGYYRVYLNDSLVFESIGNNYGHHEIFRFTCPPGTYCTDPFVADTGLITTPNGSEAWYSFVPADTGIYQISTCNLGNSCPSKIWVYDQCDNIVLSNDQTGAIFYSEEGCADGATATLFLGGGNQYYFRVQYDNGNCSGNPLNISLHYIGPVTGCTDPTACNFNPLATVNDTCYYPGDPNCTDVPDLVVLENVLRSTMQLDFIPHGDACWVEEGCLKGVNNRYLVRFTTHIQNIGTEDYYIGQTPANPSTPSNQFVWDNCHNHWHYRGYAEYLLYNNQGGVVPVGSKNGFCVLDLECYNGGNALYTCGNMGISEGCGDIYDAGLACQWVDITNIPPGTYTLVVRVNWDKSPDKIGRVEATYENNWGQGCFNLSYDGNVPVVDFLDDDCPPYIDCMGVPFGNAVMDCESNCNGTAIRGDWNQDTLRNNVDVQSYLTGALADDPNVTPCRDLYADNLITVYDAAMLQECTLHGDDINYWGLRFPCLFPSGFENDEDVVYLLPGTLDTMAKTFDIQIINPYNKLIGYEFSVSGLNIQSVENLDPGFDGVTQFDATGEILALSTTESTIQKNILPGKFVRVHYSALTAPQVCISGVTSIVNSKYQQSHTIIADPACVNSGLVGTGSPKTAFAVFVQPNPFIDKTTLYFSNEAAENVHITLTDLTGRVLRSFENIRGESVTIERGNLTSGVYLYTVSSGKGSVSGKLVVQ